MGQSNTIFMHSQQLGCDDVARIHDEINTAPTLTSLVLNNNRLGDLGVANIIQALPQTLQHLAVRDNGLTDSVCANISRLDLISLDLSNNNVETLSGLTLDNLESLDLSGSLVAEDFVANLLNFMDRHPKLITLELPQSLEQVQHAATEYLLRRAEHSSTPRSSTRFLTKVSASSTDARLQSARQVLTTTINDYVKSMQHYSAGFEQGVLT